MDPKMNGLTIDFTQGSMDYFEKYICRKFSVHRLVRKGVIGTEIFCNILH